MSTYQKSFEKFTESYIGFTTLSVLGLSILGSVAAMSVLLNGNSIGQMIQLFLVVASCMCFNGAVLAQQPPRIVFNLLLSGTFVCTAIAIINFLN